MKKHRKTNIINIIQKYIPISKKRLSKDIDSKYSKYGLEGAIEYYENWLSKYDNSYKNKEDHLVVWSNNPVSWTGYKYKKELLRKYL